MEQLKKILHYLSYVQYPFLLIALYFAYEPIFFDVDNLWPSYNKSLVFFGVAIGFTSLQDTRKVHYNFAKKIYSHPKYGRWFLYYIIGITLLFFIIGLYSFLQPVDNGIKQVAPGLIVLGISLVGMIKVVIEMIENHGGGRKKEVKES